MSLLIICSALLLIPFSVQAARIQLSYESRPPSKFELIQHPPLKKPKIGLALSGGGARGLAHIGVLKVLEKENIPVHRIAGTSMGSVVGGLYAAGFSAEQIENMALAQNWSEIFANSPQRTSLLATQKAENANHIVEFRLKGGKPVIPTGLSAGQRLIQILTELTLEADYKSQGDFDKLPISYRAIATDMVSGRKVVIREGPLSEAMRASFAVPFALTPVDRDTMLLFDGGMTDNLPVDVVRNMGSEMLQ